MRKLFVVDMKKKSCNIKLSTENWVVEESVCRWTAVENQRTNFVDSSVCLVGFFVRFNSVSTVFQLYNGGHLS